MGDRDVLPRSEERLQGRSAPTLANRPGAAGSGVVHGGGVAHCPTDAFGPHLCRAGASLFFHADEIRGALLLAKKSRANTPVTLNQMIRLIASLGGFLGRKSDGEPGAKTLWIGMQRTMDAASTIQALREDDS